MCDNNFESATGTAFITRSTNSIGWIVYATIYDIMTDSCRIIDRVVCGNRYSAEKMKEEFLKKLMK